MTPDGKQTWCIKLITGIFGGFTIMVIYAAWNFEPFVSDPPKHYPIVRCPDCHLVKQPPNECGEFTGWLWEECVDLVHRYPDGDSQ